MGISVLPSPREHVSLPTQDMEQTTVLAGRERWQISCHLVRYPLHFFQDILSSCWCNDHYKLDDFHYDTEKRHQIIKRVKFIPTLHYKHLYWGGYVSVL